MSCTNYIPLLAEPVHKGSGLVTPQNPSVLKCCLEKYEFNRQASNIVLSLRETYYSNDIINATQQDSYASFTIIIDYDIEMLKTTAISYLKITKKSAENPLNSI